MFDLDRLNQLWTEKYKIADIRICDMDNGKFCAYIDNPKFFCTGYSTDDVIEKSQYAIDYYILIKKTMNK